MQSAPANIPATTHSALATVFGEGTRSRSASRSWSPADSANRITGTRPAAPIRFGSSKTTERLCDAFTCEMSLAG